MEEITLSVVMVAEADSPYLECALYSVYNALYGMDIEVFIVDRGLSGELREKISTAFPKASVMKGDGPGWTAAANAAMRQANGEYLLLMDPTIMVGEETLRRFFFQLDQEPTIGALGLRILDTHGELVPESKRSFPHLNLLLYRLYGLSDLFPRSKKYASYYLPDLTGDKEHEVDVLSAHYMLLRREALVKVDFLDESLDRRMVDIDFCLRMWQAGYKIMYMPERVLSCETIPEEESREDWRALIDALSGFYAKHGEKIGGLDRTLCSLGLSLYPLRRSLISSSSHCYQPAKQRRLLILCGGSNYSTLETLARERIPNLKGVAHWNLNEERVMGAISRRNQIKGYTDYLFCLPDVRLDQLFLFMEKQPNKSSFYHIYIKPLDRLISLG